MGERSRGFLNGAFVALSALLLFGVGLGHVLLEPSEGRYGSIAAEMVRSGDWLVPRLNGVPHFEKPPLAMWAMASSLRLFGTDEVALRLPGAVAAALGVLVAWRIAGGAASRRALWAAALTAASPLYFGMARAATTDVYLALFAGTTLWCIVESRTRADARVRARWLTAAAAISALGFLVKGPIVWVLTLLPAIVESLWSRRPRELVQLFAPLRIALFLAIVLPWFLAVGVRVPGLLNWFVRERTGKVLVSSEGFHSGPFWYFVPVFLIGLFPAGILLLAAGRARLKELVAGRRERLLACAVILPFVVLSLSRSKLATYLLPLALPTAVLASVLLERGPARRGPSVAAGLLLALALIGFVAIPRIEALDALPRPGRAWLAGAGALLAAGALVTLLGPWLRRGAGRADTAPRALLACQAAGLLCLLPVLSQAAGNVGRLIGPELPYRVRELAADGRPIVCFRTLLRSIPFYAGRDAYVVHGDALKGPAEEVSDALRLAGDDELRDLLARGPAVVVCRTKDLDALQREVRGLGEVLESGGRVLLTNVPDEIPAQGATTAPVPGAPRTAGIRAAK